MDEETPKKRGRPAAPKLYRSTHAGKVFTKSGKVLPGETVELTTEEYESMKAYFEKVD